VILNKYATFDYVRNYIAKLKNYVQIDIQNLQTAINKLDARITDSNDNSIELSNYYNKTEIDNIANEILYGRKVVRKSFEVPEEDWTPGVRTNSSGAVIAADNQNWGDTNKNHYKISNFNAKNREFTFNCDKGAIFVNEFDADGKLVIRSGMYSCGTPVTFILNEKTDYITFSQSYYSHSRTTFSWIEEVIVPRTIGKKVTSANEEITLYPNQFYFFTNNFTSLTVTLAEPANNDIVNEYCFMFNTGDEIPVLTFPESVLLPADFKIEANKRYKIKILENCLSIQSWNLK
jgi:hypothetical protein